MIVSIRICVTEVVIVKINNILFCLFLDINTFFRNILYFSRINLITELFAALKFVKLFEGLTVKIFYDIFQFSNFMLQFIY